MKKLIAFLAVIVMVFTFAACGGPDNEDDPGGNGGNKQPQAISTADAFEKISDSLSALIEEAKTAEGGYSLGLAADLSATVTMGQISVNASAASDLKIKFDFGDIISSLMYCDFSYNIPNPDNPMQTLNDTGHVFWKNDEIYQLMNGVKSKSAAPLSVFVPTLTGYQEGGNFLPLLMGYYMETFSQMPMPIDVTDPSDAHDYIMNQANQDLAFALLFNQLSNANVDPMALFSATTLDNTLTIEFNYAPLKLALETLLNGVIAEISDIADDAETFMELLDDYPLVKNYLYVEASINVFYNYYIDFPDFSEILNDLFENTSNEDYLAYLAAVKPDIDISDYGGDVPFDDAAPTYYDEYERFFEWLNEYPEYLEAVYAYEMEVEIDGENQTVTLGELIEEEFEDKILSEMGDYELAVLPALNALKQCIPSVLTIEIIVEFNDDDVITSIDIDFAIEMKIFESPAEGSSQYTFTDVAAEISFGLDITRGNDVVITLPSDLSGYYAGQEQEEETE